MGQVRFYVTNGKPESPMKGPIGFRRGSSLDRKQTPLYCRRLITARQSFFLVPLPFPIFPIKEQEKISEKLDKAFENIYSLKARMDKIPDLRMDLVIQERRDFYERQIGNEFTDYYLAHRTRALQQKLGRLLRTENDFGGAIIVDSRIKKWKGKTFSTLMKLMEPYQIERSSLEQACEGVKTFIQSKI